MTERIEKFAKQWVIANVRKTPGIDLSYEVDRLSAKITADARADGISGLELARSVGDIDDFLTIAYDQAPEPETTLRDSKRRAQRPQTPT
jgi:hypothetical protein